MVMIMEQLEKMAVRMLIMICRVLNSIVMPLLQGMIFWRLNLSFRWKIINSK